MVQKIQERNRVSPPSLFHESRYPGAIEEAGRIFIAIPSLFGRAILSHRPLCDIESEGTGLSAELSNQPAEDERILNEAINNPCRLPPNRANPPSPVY